LSSRMPPNARRCDCHDEPTSRRIDDPYRWMEEDTPERRAWVRAQHEYATAQLAALPCREDLRRRLDELMRPIGAGTFAQAGERSFLLRRSADRELPALYRQDAPDVAPRLLLDPNEFSVDRSVRLADIHPSRDGSLIAYRLSRSGSSRMSLHVLDADAGQDLPDVVPDEMNPVAQAWHTRNQVVWAINDGGFYYTRCRLGASVKESRYDQKLYFHCLGEDWRDDILVFGESLAREQTPYPQLSEDGRRLLVLVQDVSGTEACSQLYLFDRQAPDRGFLPIMHGIKAFLSAAMHRDVLYIKTNHQAPSGKLLAISLAEPACDDVATTTVIPEGAHPLGAWAPVGDYLVVETIEDVSSRLRVHDLSGRLVKQIELPSVGSVKALDSPREGNAFFFSFSSFLTPRSVYRLDLETLESAIHLHSESPFESNAFQVERIRFGSRDSTQIPMFLLHKRGMARTGDAAAVVHVYGGFGVSQTPSFAAHAIPFLERGGVYAVVCARGGGELGEDWHRAGAREHKQNVFDDLIAAGEWLIAQRYAHPARLGCFGWSNGGLTVTAAAVQRPDLWKAVVAGAPVTDMARFHTAGGGRNWIAEYGSPEHPDDLDVLMRYSPYHTLPSRIEAPAILTIVPDEDDRVAPWHGYKMHAAWLAANVSENPVLLLGEARAGHRGSPAVSRAIDRYADIWAFFFERLDAARYSLQDTSV
jgi:prolyl oligopeptidase